MNPHDTQAITPTIDAEVSEEEVSKLQAEKYFQLVPLTIHRKPFVECESCSA